VAAKLARKLAQSGRGDQGLSDALQGDEGLGSLLEHPVGGLQCGCISPRGGFGLSQGFLAGGVTVVGPAQLVALDPQHVVQG